VALAPGRYVLRLRGAGARAGRPVAVRAHRFTLVVLVVADAGRRPGR